MPCQIFHTSIRIRLKSKPLSSTQRSYIFHVKRSSYFSPLNDDAMMIFCVGLCIIIILKKKILCAIRNHFNITSIMTEGQKNYFLSFFLLFLEQVMPCFITTFSFSELEKCLRRTNMLTVLEI